MKQSILRKTKNRIFHYSHASLWSPARSPAGGFAFFILAAPEAIAVDPIAEFAAFRHKHTLAARFSTRDIIHVQPAISTCRDTVVLFSVSAGPVIIYNQAPVFPRCGKTRWVFRALEFSVRKNFTPSRGKMYILLFFISFSSFFFAVPEFIAVQVGLFSTHVNFATKRFFIYCKFIVLGVGLFYGYDCTPVYCMLKLGFLDMYSPGVNLDSYNICAIFVLEIRECFISQKSFVLYWISV